MAEEAEVEEEMEVAMEVKRKHLLVVVSVVLVQIVVLANAVKAGQVAISLD